jgi:hypothetical protein
MCRIARIAKSSTTKGIMTTTNVRTRDSLLPVNAALMIQVWAHHGAVPVEPFLRAEFM